MIAMLFFSAAAALLVHLAGRSDAARDPRLTAFALLLLASFPLLLALLPKLPVLPGVSTGGDHPGFPWLLAVSAIWLTISITGLSGLAITAWRLAQWRNRSELLGHAGRIEIRRSDRPGGPVASGVFRPVVFVPRDWMNWPEETRRIVLDHELAHHRRRDPLRRWIAAIACAIHAYNPLVVWMARRLTAQCEFACDAALLKAGVEPREYARLLCDVADDHSHRTPVFAIAEKAGLEARIRRMLNPRRPASPLAIAILILITLAAAGAIASLGNRPATGPIPRSEAELRWSADPFPAD